MKAIGLFLVQPSVPVRVAVAATIREAFPETTTVEVGTVEDAVRHKRELYPELLILTDASATETARATQIMDASGSPRWAVVVLGQETVELADTVPPEAWQPRLLAQVFRSALLQHGLLCENLRLRGDLKTVARRFSHDLYTPIGCIHTSAAVLKLLSPTDEQSKETIVQNIEDSSVEASQLIERMSFVLKASADPCAPTEVDMGEVVSAALKQLETSIQKTGATVMTPVSWPAVTGVQSWLKVIWWNLLGNALKHGGPTVRIRIGWDAEENRKRFWITNNGPGVKPENLAGMFRPFDQLHAERTCGLGLSIVHRLTSLHGGECGIYPVPEGGTCFYFTLPAEKSGTRSGPA